MCFFFQAEDGIRDYKVTGVQTCARPILTLKLSRAGVTIGTGTDIWQVPTGVHMELEELVNAGLTPLEAIRAATGSEIGRASWRERVWDGVRDEVAISKSLYLSRQQWSHQ